MAHPITKELAQQLFTDLRTDAQNRAAEVGRDLLMFKNDTNVKYVTEQEETIRELHLLSMEILEMIEDDKYDKKRVNEIRDYIGKDSIPKTNLGS